MKRILLAADLFFFVPFLFLYMFMYSDSMGYLESGICIMLLSFLGLLALLIFQADFAKKTYIFHHKFLCTVLEIFENTFYLFFFIGLMSCLNIQLIPK